MTAGLVLLLEEQYSSCIIDDSSGNYACCTLCLIVSLGGRLPWSYCSMYRYCLAALYADTSVVALRH